MVHRMDFGAGGSKYESVWVEGEKPPGAGVVSRLFGGDAGPGDEQRGSWIVWIVDRGSDWYCGLAA